MAGAATTTSVAMVLAVLALGSNGLYGAHGDAAFISRTCKKIKHATLCADVLRLDEERAEKASTVHDLASLALEIATDAANFYYIMIRDGTRDSEGKDHDMMFICLGAYTDAVDDLDTAKPTFDVGKYDNASKLVLGAKAAGDVCDNAFKQAKMDPPMAELNRHMREKCGVAGELIGLLVHKL